MPVARATGWRLRAGTHTVANLTTTYALSALPVQADQDADWTDSLPSRLVTAPRRARIVTMADGSRQADGFFIWQWGFSYMSLGMYNYWAATFLAGGVQSAAVTAMTYTEADVAIYLQATLIRPETLSVYIGGYRDVIFEFSMGTVIT
jgi:hypothetical protein